MSPVAEITTDEALAMFVAIKQTRMASMNPFAVRRAELTDSLPKVPECDLPADGFPGQPPPVAIPAEIGRYGVNPGPYADGSWLDRGSIRAGRTALGERHRPPSGAAPRAARSPVGRAASDPTLNQASNPRDSERGKLPPGDAEALESPRAETRLRARVGGRPIWRTNRACPCFAVRRGANTPATTPQSSRAFKNAETRAPGDGTCR